MQTELKTCLNMNPEWRTVCIFFGGYAPFFVPDLVRSLKGMAVRVNARSALHTRDVLTFLALLPALDRSPRAFIHPL